MKTTIWKKKLLTLLILVTCLGYPYLPPGSRHELDVPAAPGRKGLTASIPGVQAFIANQGQRDDVGPFYAQGPGYLLDFGERGVQLVTAEARLHIDFTGARAVQPVGEAPLDARINVFLGSDPERWRTGIPAYGRLRYAALYPGIDLVYTPGPELLKTTFYVEPGGDLSQIRLRYRDAEKLEVDTEGVLHISFAGG